MRYPQLYGTAIHVDSDMLVHFDYPNELPLLTKHSVSKDNRFFTSREAAPNIGFVMRELRAKGWLGGIVGLEYWSYVPNRAVSTMFEGAFLAEGCRVVDGSAIVRARRVKSPREIACIEKAVTLADVGHRTVRRLLRPGITELELLKADLCGVYHRYHGNVMRGYYLGDPPAAMLDRHRRAAGAFEVMRAEVRAGMTVREVIAILRRYYQEAELWNVPGWALGYELGLSLPPDWVGAFYFHVHDDKYLDRVFEENMVTNFESIFSTWLVDTCVYERTGTRFLSAIPLELIAVG
jgi:Xaa-Pro aminopeptidase